jgi:hypothetical protein
MHRTHNVAHQASGVAETAWVAELERLARLNSSKSAMLERKAAELHLLHWQRKLYKQVWRARLPWIAALVLLALVLFARLAWGQPAESTAGSSRLARVEHGGLRMTRERGLAVGPCVRLSGDEGWTCTFEMRTLLSADEGVKCGCTVHRSLGRARLVCECVTPNRAGGRGGRGKRSDVSAGGSRAPKRARIGVPRPLEVCDIPGECG